MLIIGASGFSLESLEVYISNNNSLDEITFFDNVSKVINPLIEKQFPVIRSFEEVKLLPKNFEFILGIGTPSAREKLFTIFTSEFGGTPFNLISKNTNIGVMNNTIKKGVNIMTGSIITSNCHIGHGVLINLNVTIGHDTTIHDFVEICPGVNISGNCEIGKSAFIGTGAILLPSIKIGEGAVIAAGSVVIKDVPPYTLYAGNPAVFKKTLN
jgi:sugar O-acyltransferase (sialic acid O-acetyltransferase NeuD family)